jgi:hypothetical protein
MSDLRSVWILILLSSVKYLSHQERNWILLQKQVNRHYIERVCVWSSRQEQNFKSLKKTISFPVPFLGNRLMPRSLYPSFLRCFAMIFYRAVVAGWSFSQNVNSTWICWSACIWNLYTFLCKGMVRKVRSVFVIMQFWVIIATKCRAHKWSL